MLLFFAPGLMQCIAELLRGKSEAFAKRNGEIRVLRITAFRGNFLFEREIINSILTQLKRIYRKVWIEELSMNPFREEVSIYIKSFSVRNENIIVETDFNDVSEKQFSALYDDDEITLWGAIMLLEQLSKIK